MHATHKTKVLVLHPPMYPINYKFYNLLGKTVDLTIWQFGEYPSDHPNWTYDNLKYLNTNMKFKIIGKRSDSIKNQLYILKYLKALKDLNPDIVVSIAFWIPSLLISILNKTFSFKFIILTNAIDETEKNSSSFRKYIRKQIVKNTNHFISASNLTSEFIKTIDQNASISLSIQTTDVNEWHNEFSKLESKVELKEKFLIDKSKVIMLGVGNYIKKKNWISVFKILKEIDNILFLLVGDGEDKELYMNIIKSNNLQEKVVLIDRKSGRSLKEYYRVSDFLIFPSLYDQFGFVVAEALSSDLPVICTKKAGSEILILDNYNGYKYKNDTELLNILNLMIKNFNSLNKNTFKSIKNITLENRVREFNEIFNKVLRK